MLFEIKDQSKEVANHSARLDYIENRIALTAGTLSDYVSFFAGYSAGTDSFIRKYGNIVELYLVINGTFTENTSPEVCQLKGIIPYSANSMRRFPLVIPNGGWTSNATVNTNNGVVTAVIPSGVSGGSVVLNALYTVHTI